METDVKGLPQWISSLFLRHPWSSWISPGCLASKAQDHPISASLVLGLQAQNSTPGFYVGGWAWTHSSVLMLAQQALYQRRPLTASLCTNLHEAADIPDPVHCPDRPQAPVLGVLWSQPCSPWLMQRAIKDAVKRDADREKVPSSVRCLHDTAHYCSG